MNEFFKVVVDKCHAHFLSHLRLILIRLIGTEKKEEKRNETKADGGGFVLGPWFPWDIIFVD